MKILALTFVLLLAPVVQAQEIRVDTFDKRSNRTGYFVIDPRTGRVDQFDKRSNRLGYGTVASPPSSSSTDSSSTPSDSAASVTSNRRTR